MKTTMLLSVAALVIFSGSAGAQLTMSSGSIRSSASCSSAADAQSYKQETDASVSAVANAIKKGCTGDAKTLVRDWENDYESGFGTAFAKAVTSVDAACETEGQAFGCAAAQAYATAFAEAAASAHAEATAKAFAGCKCLESSAKSQAFGEAATYIALIAEAVSLVKARACAKNGSANSASAYQKCIGKATAKVFAKATADAFIASDCWDAQTKTQITADVGGDFFLLEGCEPAEESSTKGGMTSVMGMGSADAFEDDDFFSDIAKMG